MPATEANSPTSADVTANKSTSWWQRLRTAGVSEDDAEDVRLSKTLLAWATGMVSMASVLWLVMYDLVGLNFSPTVPFLYQLVLTANFLWYTKRGNFVSFRAVQLALFLFAPFVVQWSIGNTITASGIVIWGLLGPVGAILCIGERESIPWFVAWAVLVAVSGGMDYYLMSDPSWRPQVAVPMRVSLFFFVINFLSVSTVLYLLLRYSAKEKQFSHRRFIEAHNSLWDEQQRSENLLLNILPINIAKRLKSGESNIANGHADVTVLFADVVDFTRRARHMAPHELFSMLNKLFTVMDDLTAHYHLEKIKTIGDAYMVSGGLPGTHVDYTAAVLSFAIDINRRIKAEPVLMGETELHIGIATGPVVAGVIGKYRFIYDMWGDTVNLSSRLCTESAAGSIIVDQTTHDRLQSRFSFHPPMKITLKGMGETAAYPVQF